MLRLSALLLALLIAVAGAQGAPASPLSLPALDAADLGGARLRVVATTSIVGDVVARVGGDAVDLVVLMPPGQDPHGFEPAARDLAAASRAEAVFVNGWGLEESLLGTLERVAAGVPFVPVSAGIAPLETDGRPDPHTWYSVANVARWTDNVEATLAALDPANADRYAANADAYRADLADLDRYARERFDALPEGRRVLVTNHDAFGYFARAYGFEVLGAVIPSASTLAEPSARDLAALVDAMASRGVCTLFTETTVSDRLARTVAGELPGCATVEVVPLYTDAIGPPGSGAESYLAMMRVDVDRIAEGLGE